MTEAGDSPIFATVKFFVTGLVDEKTIKLLEKGGGTRGKFLSFATHVICGKDSDETEIGEAQDLYDLPAVDERWVLASVKLGRLANTKAYDPSPNKLFSKLVFALSGGLTPTDNKSLYACIRFHGGAIERNYTEKTSVLVCPSATGSAYAKAIAVGSERTKVVTPDWIVDCLQEKRQVDAQPYHPRLLIVSSTMPRKIIQVGLVAANSSGTETEVKIQQQPPNTSTSAAMEIEKQQTKTTLSPVTGTATIGATIRPIKVTQTAQGIITVPGKNVVIQTQGNAVTSTAVPPPQGIPISINVRPVVQNSTPASVPVANVTTNDPPKAEVTSTEQIPKTIITASVANAVPGNNTPTTPVTAPTTSLVTMVQQQQQTQKPPNQTVTIQSQPQSQTVKITQQTVVPGTSAAGTTIAPSSSSGESSSAPSTPLATIKQIQFMPSQMQTTSQSQPTTTLQKPSMIIQTSSGTTVSGHVVVQQQQQQSQQQQQLTTVQSQPQTTSGQQNILIIQQQQNPNANPNQETPKQQLQLPQQSQQQQQVQQQVQQLQSTQSLPQSPVQTPQFSNVQFIRSTSQPMPGGGVGIGTTTTVMTSGGAVVTQHTPVQQSPHPEGLQQQQQTQIVQIQQGQPQGQPQQVTYQQQQQTPQSPHGQMIISQQGIVGGGQPQFIRTTSGGIVRGPGPQQQQPQQQHWTASPGGGPQQPQLQQGMAPRQVIQIDPQTWAAMDPAKKAEYVAKLQSRRNIMMQQQRPMLGRPQGPPQGPGGIMTTTRMPGNGQPQNIVFRGQWVQPQQQQVQQRQILVRSNAPGLSPIQQMVTTGPGGAQQVVQGVQITNGQQQITVPGPQGGVGGPQTIQVQLDPNQQQQQGPRPQFQRMTSLPGQKVIQQQTQQQINGQTIQTTTRYVTMDGSPLNPDQVQQMVQAGTAVDMGNGQPQMINKTKTALANMLNSRMTGNSVLGVPPGVDGSAPGGVPGVVGEPSAAGTLRLMTAHHNAALNQSMGGPRAAQELLSLQQQQQQQQAQLQQQQQQQRRTLGNITNAPGGSTVSVVIGGGPGGGPQMVSGVPQGPVNPVHMAIGPQGPVGVMKGAPYSPIRTAQPRPQFYGHNPNLPKLPPELFLLGCNFFIVEYDETHAEDLLTWKELMRKHGGEIESFYCPRVTHVLCRSQRHGVVMQAIRDSKRCVTAHWLNDVLLKKQLLPPWQALHLPAPATFGRQRPATRHIVSVSGFEGEERMRIKKMVAEAGAKLTSYFCKQNTVLVCKKLDGLKYRRAKDWGVPVVNATWLADILMGNLSTMSNFDTPKYQQYNLSCPFRIEYTLVPHLMTSWKAPINLNQESHERLKRCHSEAVPGPKPKRPARTLPPPAEVIPETFVVQKTVEPENAPRVMFSQVENVEGLSRAVTSFGGSVVTDAAEATHLVMTQLVRTSKLLQCLCTVKHILSSDWLVDSVAAGELLTEDKYPLQDPEFVQAFRCDVQEVLKRETADRGKLFEGRTFHMTPSVKPSVKALTRMIELSGGRVEKGRRSLIKIHEANTQSPQSYTVLACAGDLHLLTDILRSKQHSRIVCTTEFVMASVMSQKVDMAPHTVGL